MTFTLVRLLRRILPLRQGGDIQCPDGHREKDSCRCPLLRAVAVGDGSKFSRRSAVDWLRAATHQARTAPAPSRVAEVAAVQRLSVRRKIRRMTRPDQTRRHQPDRLVARVASSDAPATATRNQQIVLRAVAVRRDRETLRRFRSIPFLCRNCIYG